MLRRTSGKTELCYKRLQNALWSDKPLPAHVPCQYFGSFWFRFGPPRGLLGFFLDNFGKMSSVPVNCRKLPFTGTRPPDSCWTVLCPLWVRSALIWDSRGSQKGSKSTPTCLKDSQRHPRARDEAQRLPMGVQSRHQGSF